MRRYLLAAALFATCIAAQADDPPPAELPPDQEAAALRSAEATGATIFEHDRAAAVATDAALAIPEIRKDARVKGWITEERGDNIVVTFIDEAPAALFRVTVSAAGDVIGEVERLEAPESLTAFESGAVVARTVALASGFEPCSERYNSVVLPVADAPGRWVVYLLPATTRNDVVPIGGTYRVETDGQGVLSRRGFTRSCIALQNDASAVGLFVTHLLDSTPTEAHVFWGLWVGKALFVSTPPNGTLWQVEGGKIGLVERGDAGE